MVGALQETNQGLIDLIVAGERDEAQNQRRDQEHTQFPPVHSASRSRSRIRRMNYGSNSFSTALQRSQTVG